KAYPDKETNVNGALGYNSYMLIVKAIENAKSAKPAAITKALAATKDLPTALGKLSINATHDAEMPVGIIEYKDGKRVYVGEVTPK
ncbi:MAG: ABC transporter substrate-binding protein, partial [Desulfovibrionaceae bacterium]|nr:ABC transporter substrate-binding protein [Desulfovibrionaceae bacterium]